MRPVWREASLPVADLYNTWIGDANLDGEFNSGDLVAVLSSGTYEADVDAVWSSGDFDGSGRTDSGDLVAALADGGDEAGPRAAVNAVPEPRSRLLCVLGILPLWMGNRRRRLNDTNRLIKTAYLSQGGGVGQQQFGNALVGRAARLIGKLDRSVSVANGVVQVRGEDPSEVICRSGPTRSQPQRFFQVDDRLVGLSRCNQGV